VSLLLVALLLTMGAWVHRRVLAACGGGVVLHLLRLPGNLLHESAHAVAFLATGYTVRGFRVSLFDPRGRGHVVPGDAWTAWTRPWVANLLAPIAPAVAGVAVLAWMGFAVFGPVGPQLTPSAIPELLAHVAWRAPLTWGVLVLATPVAAEAAPSDVDLRAWAVPAVTCGVLALAVLAALRAWAPAMAASVDAAAVALDSRMVPWVVRALVAATWGLAGWMPAAWLLARLRGG
jgi:hypothetical protein